MTDHEMQIAIAMACGWKETVFGWWEHEGKGSVFEDPPDYLHDLNAMFDAEEWLLNKSMEQPTDELWAKYRWHLEKSAGITFHATAKERADAFLKAIGWNYFKP